MIGNTPKVTPEITSLIERMSALRLQPKLSQAECAELLDLTTRLSAPHLDRYEQRDSGKDTRKKGAKQRSTPYAIRSCMERYLSRRGGNPPPPPPPPSAMA